MPRLSELLANSASLTIEFPGADVRVTYRPGIYTRELEASLNGLEELPNDEACDRCDEILSALIADWDLTDEDEQPIPLKRGMIADKVPTVFLYVFVRKLIEAIAGEVVAGRRQTTEPTPLPLNRVERRAQARRNTRE